MAHRTLTLARSSSSTVYQAPESCQCLACASNVRLIALDRPGVGLTSPGAQDDSTFDISPADVSHGLDTVGVKSKVSLVGYSMGAPHALKYLLEAPERIKTVHLIGPAGFFIPRPAKEQKSSRYNKIINTSGQSDSMALPNYMAHILVQYAPWLLKIICTLSAASLVHEDDYASNVIKSTSKQDLAKLEKDDQQLWKMTTRKTFRQSIEGMLQAVSETFGRHAPSGWGWDVAEVKNVSQKQNIDVHVHAAEHDLLTPLSSVMELADIIGIDPINVRLHDDGIGHLSLLGVALKEIVERR